MQHWLKGYIRIPELGTRIILFFGPAEEEAMGLFVNQLRAVAIARQIPPDCFHAYLTKSPPKENEKALPIPDDVVAMFDLVLAETKQVVAKFLLSGETRGKVH